MQFMEFRKLFKDFAVFSLSDILMADPGFHRRRLNEWQDKGYIRKIINKFYIFSEAAITEETLYHAANKVYEPSYVSLETALSYYHLIPEGVYGITSVTTKRTYSFNSSLAQFIYRTVKTELFFGYEIVNRGGAAYKIAILEKAVLDYMYIHSDVRDNAAFESMRINAEQFLGAVDEKKLLGMLERFSNEALAKRVNRLMEYMKHA